MKIKTTPGERIFRGWNALFMMVLMIITLYPFLYVLFASLSNANLLMAHQGLLWKPLEITATAYQMAFRDPMILRGLFNSVCVILGGVTLNILLSSFGAYFLASKSMLKRPITLIILFTMFFSGGTIPFYLTVRNYGLYDSYWALVLPVAVNTYNMIILRTAFASIPDSLVEAARIDGAGHMTILFRIVMPLSLATLAVIGLYYTVSHWNAWFNASIFLGSRSKYPLQIILREILVQNDTTNMTMGAGTANEMPIGETIKYAVVIIATIPIICVYPFLQKYFVKGVMIGAVKG